MSTPLIAEVPSSYDGQHDDPVAEANARLIATAPLLFECLKLIQGAMAVSQEVKGTDRYRLEFTAAALNGITAAIDQVEEK